MVFMWLVLFAGIDYFLFGTSDHTEQPEEVFSYADITFLIAARNEEKMILK